MSNLDLVKWTTSDVDFYSLLGLAFENFSASELRRAYRKTALKYHPDKVGKDFDPDKYELFQAANEVLSNSELKAKYDNHRNAKIQKQRANELFEGRRRQMKDDLEARERGEVPNNGVGLKRGRDEEGGGEMAQELRKLAEEGRKRRAARQSMMSESFSSPAPAAKQDPKPEPQKQPQRQASVPADVQEEDEVARLERRIREMEAAKAKRKAEKKSRKSGLFVPPDSPSVDSIGSKTPDARTPVATQRPNIFNGIKANDKSSASPKFSFSPSIATPKRNDFAATMARLKAAEKQRLEDEIRTQESGGAI